MVKNTSRENSAVSKPGWGAIRWADLSISDASNSWLCTQSDTKNESKSLGLTSLLQKNAKIDDNTNQNPFSDNELATKKENIQNKGIIKGFLTKNKSVKNASVGHEKFQLPILKGIEGDINRESSESIENSQELESLEFKFGEKIDKNTIVNKDDQFTDNLIQNASLNSPKIFGQMEILFDKTSKNVCINKKRDKNYIEEIPINENCNNSPRLSEKITCKKVKHSKTSTGNEIYRTKVLDENLCFNAQEGNEKNIYLKKKTIKNQFNIPKRTKNNVSTKLSTIETPKTPRFNKNIDQIINSNKIGDTQTENTPNSNVDWNKRISSRLFQIAIGKGTRAYQNYLKLKPRKEDREQNDPQTPNAHTRCPQKQFTDQLNHWRKSLHQYDDLDVNISHS